MNLKKTAVTVFAAAAMTLSLATPLMAADETGSHQRSSNVSVNEDGGLTYKLNANLSFGSVDVTNTQDGNATSSPHNVQIKDTHSQGPGYQLQMSASDLTWGDYYIDSENLSWVMERRGGDMACRGTSNEIVGGNPYQEVDWVYGTYTFGDAFSFVTATPGRGCGELALGGDFHLLVPAGTATGGGTAVYSGSITLSNVAGVGGE